MRKLFALLTVVFFAGFMMAQNNEAHYKPKWCYIINAIVDQTGSSGDENQQM